MLGKSSKNLLPNAGLMVIYLATIRKKSPQKTEIMQLASLGKRQVFVLPQVEALKF